MRAIAEQEPLLIFRVGPVLCCARVHDVDSIVVPQPFTRFPGQAADVAGVFKYRSHTVSVVKLHMKFGLPEIQDPESGRIIMAYTRHGLMGFWADDIEEITSGYEENFSEPPKFGNGNIFDKTLIWREKIVLHTDFNSLAAMTDSLPLANWIAANKNQLDSNVPQAESQTSANISLATVDGESHNASQASQVSLPVVEPVAEADNSVAGADLNQDEVAPVAEIATDDEDIESSFEATETSIDPPEAEHQLSDEHIAEALDALDEDAKSENDILEESEVDLAQAPQNASEADLGREEELFEPQEEIIEEVFEEKQADSIETAADLSDEPESLFEVEGLHESERDSDQQAVSDSHEPDHFQHETVEFLEVVEPSKSPASVHTAHNRADAFEGVEEHIKTYEYAPEINLDAPADNRATDVSGKSFYTPVKIVGSASALVLVAAIAGYMIFSGDVAPTTDDVKTIQTEQSVIAPEETSLASTAKTGVSDQEDSASEGITMLEERDNTGLQISEEATATAEQNIVAEFESSIKESVDKVQNIVPIETVAIPLEPVEPQPIPVWNIHDVSKGDTLWALAGRYLNNPFRYPELAAWNSIKNPNLIYPGDKVKYKKKDSE